MLRCLCCKPFKANTLTETHYSLFLSDQCISRKGRKGNYAKPAKSYILAAAFSLYIFCVNRISVVRMTKEMRHFFAYGPAVWGEKNTVSPNGMKPIKLRLFILLNFFPLRHLNGYFLLKKFIVRSTPIVQKLRIISMDLSITAGNALNSSFSNLLSTKSICWPFEKSLPIPMRSRV